ncbi:hypothetical protein [Nocardioides alcanivorans]|uniref:hypothetical protein n=1 Tax=Nocardioides alcanivorans TaxID=2897352 RepID=UPI001F203436|nr:hypothetical protein [Nocardioides alcanivorans]
MSAPEPEHPQAMGLELQSSSMDLLVLPSPLLPSAAYDSLAEALAARGVHGSVASTGPVSTPERIIERWTAQASARLRSFGAALLAHSNAGLLAPAVRASVGVEAPIVFMDAALPPADGAAALAPEGLRGHLASLVDESSGLLPPWTRWWSREEMLRTIPSGVWASIDSRCPSVPLSYFDARIRPPEEWASGNNAYLAFGDTYAEQLDFATRRAWPTRRLDGGHLEFLWQADVVADAVLNLVSAAGVRS